MGDLPPRLGRTVGRRVLVLYRARPDALASHLPQGMRPRLLRGHAIVGACYTKLGPLRSRWLPHGLGTATEHLAYHVAAEGDDDAHATWVMRRTTSSWLRAHGGRHVHRSSFDLREDPFGLELSIENELYLRAERAPALRGSIFESPQEAREFLGAESSGLAPEALQVFEARSSLLDDESLFPPGSVQLDTALRLVDRSLSPVHVRSTSRLRDVLERGEATRAVPGY